MTSEEAKPDPNSDPRVSPWNRSPAEWVTFGFACMILLTLIGLILVDWVISQNRPPVLQVQTSGPIRVVEDQYYVPFIVSNQGGAIAESIQVMADLMVDGKPVESGDQSIDSLSGGEKREGRFVFSFDPNQGELLLRVASYRLPQPLAPSTLPEWMSQPEPVPPEVSLEVSPDLS